MGSLSPVAAAVASVGTGVCEAAKAHRFPNPLFLNEQCLLFASQVIGTVSPCWLLTREKDYTLQYRSSNRVCECV